MGEKIELPAPQTESEMSVENAMSLRRSNRSFAKKPLSLRQIGQILWSAQGITREGGRKRAAPSAGATYPLEVHIGVQEGGVDGLDGGIYSYDPTDNSLEQEEGEYIPEEIVSAAFGQDFLAVSPVNVLIAADYCQTTDRYGERGIRYVHMEVGHAGENIHLQTVSMGLSTVAVGAFNDDEVSEVFALSDREKPLYIMPVGYSAEDKAG